MLICLILGGGQDRGWFRKSSVQTFQPLICLILGGGQERGLRSGTVPTPLTVGMGAACAIAKAEMENDKEHVTRLANKLVQVSARFLLDESNACIKNKGVN